MYHSVENSNPQEQHKYCMDESVQWCSYKNELNNPSTGNAKKRKEKLPQSFLPHMLPLCKRLSDESLLKRCVGGLTQNQNEAYNDTV